MGKRILKVVTSRVLASALIAIMALGLCVASPGESHAAVGLADVYNGDPVLEDSVTTTIDWEYGYGESYTTYYYYPTSDTARLIYEFAYPDDCGYSSIVIRSYPYVSMSLMAEFYYNSDLAFHKPPNIVSETFDTTPLDLSDSPAGPWDFDPNAPLKIFIRCGEGNHHGDKITIAEDNEQGFNFGADNYSFANSRASFGYSANGKIQRSRLPWPRQAK